MLCGLAARGAKVVVNDLGRNGAPSDNALSVVEEIRAGGGTAMADSADVADFEQVSAMAARAEKDWGRVDILVNNAGVLRDKSFAKMEMADFEFVLRVHLIGSANCAKAVWAGMRERAYGRIVLTSSASGIYGNFGQANYGAAKAAMIGLMNVLHLEGAKTNVRVNILAPTARTGMTEGLLSPVAAELMTPESVTPGVLFLVSEDAPSRVILGAGAGVFAVTHIGETPGLYLDESERTPETIAARFAEISDRATAEPLKDAFSQTYKFVARGGQGEGGQAGDEEAGFKSGVSRARKRFVFDKPDPVDRRVAVIDHKIHVGRAVNRHDRGRHTQERRPQARVPRIASLLGPAFPKSPGTRQRGDRDRFDEQVVRGVVAHHAKRRQQVGILDMDEFLEDAERGRRRRNR